MARGGPITPVELERVALRYLDRYWTTRAWLRRLLEGKVEAAIEAHGGDRREAALWVEALLDRLEASGLIDDDRYARGRADALLRRGTSKAGIRAKLHAKQVPADVIDRVLHAIPSGDEAMLAPAAEYARRRRLGPYRASDRRQHREKDLARLVRRGFSFGAAKTVIDMATAEALEDALRDAEERAERG